MQTPISPANEPKHVHEVFVPVRVRYPECDPQGVAHHASYVIWLEIARTELLRAAGHAYKDLEARGVYMVVARLNVKYRMAARYDDELTIHCIAEPTHGGKLVHQYRVLRGGQLLVEADTTLVCVDADGRMQKMPPEVLPSD